MSDSNFEEFYYPEIDVEVVERYRPNGFHPTIIGDTFCDARDHRFSRYVALKIVIAGESQESREGGILRLLAKGIRTASFFSEGQNGRHRCLVQEPAGYNVVASKENSSSCMFPRDAARSIAAQLIMGLYYLHKNDICHGDLYPHNFLLRVPGFDNLDPAELYERLERPLEIPLRRLDGKTPAPHGPPHVFLVWRMPATKMEDPEIITTDYGTFFVASQTSSPTLQTPDLYAPPEALFEEPITIPTAVDIWTRGISLYEVLGRRRLFEAFAWCPDDIIGEMARSESLNQNGAWVSDFKRFKDPDSRSLHQKMWTMERGKTPETCEWDVQGGEMRALEDMLRSMMSFEPEKRPTANQLLESEYMVKWALPAWERQKQRKMEKDRNSDPDTTGIEQFSPSRALAIVQAHLDGNEPLSIVLRK
ncbi:kinase domain-containing protein [Aspergillus stella-maris]|uniref:kinase domain-containing protein n=1 Tax=Aspergillus stella-maris TaxID=1810926 RepID=UPI003CCD47CA